MRGRSILVLGCIVAALVALASCASLKSGMSSGMKTMGMKVAEVKHQQVKLADLDSRFEPWAGGPLDVFATEPVEYTCVDLPELDQFNKDVAYVLAVTTLARHVVQRAKEGNADAIAGAVMLAAVCQDALGKCQSLVSQGQNLVGALPARLANPQYAPIADDVLLSAKTSLANAGSALANIPGIISDLSGIESAD